MAYMEKTILNEQERAIVNEVLIALQNAESDRKTLRDGRSNEETKKYAKKAIEGQTWRALQTIKVAHLLNVITKDQMISLQLISLRVCQDGANLDEVWSNVFKQFKCREEKGARPSSKVSGTCLCYGTCKCGKATGAV